jgi:methionine biosynthesis protein MetW
MNAAAAHAHHKLARRHDFEAIAQWVRQGARVLDLGCGDGSLMRYLRETRSAGGYGIEIDDAKIIASVRNGVNVIQSNLETGLSGFETHAFDYVILSLTLQAVHRTEALVREMLRVGRQGIVSFPNFGYWRHRVQLVAGGRMPVSRDLPYQWYDTPNVHLFTIRDFEVFCASHGLRILDRVVMDGGGARTHLMPNLLGALAVYRLDADAPSRAGGAAAA